jgi:FkbM family methyltransferase
MKRLVKHLLRKRGFEIRRYTDNKEGQNLIKLLKSQSINTVFDVGANVGQYSTRLRTLGFKGWIHSFEPLPDAYSYLQRLALKDDKWYAYNLALGSEPGKNVINRSANSYSSSILDLEQAHIDVAPESRFVEQIEISIRTLKEEILRIDNLGEGIFLKVDTQGYENQVIKGAGEFIEKIKGVQLEMSLIPLYKDEILFEQFLGMMSELGFSLYQLEPGLVDNKSGRLLQVDGIFFKS